MIAIMAMSRYCKLFSCAPVNSMKSFPKCDFLSLLIPILLLRYWAVSEFLAFNKKYYVPNNAVLVVAGDIDIPKTKKTIVVPLNELAYNILVKYNFKLPLSSVSKKVS